MDEESSPLQQIFEGIGVVLALLFAFFLVTYAIFITWADWGPNGPTNEWTNIPMLLVAFCGLSQAVYVIPSFLFFRKKNRPHVARGILLGAALVLVGDVLAYFWWTRP